MGSSACPAITWQTHLFVRFVTIQCAALGFTKLLARHPGIRFVRNALEEERVLCGGLTVSSAVRVDMC